MEKILHYMFLCHRLPERSFFIKGKQFPICARCTGILAGYFAGIIYVVLFDVKFYTAALLMIPLVIDGTGQYYGKWLSTNPRRFVTGVMAGISVICLFAYGTTLGHYLGNIIAESIKQRI